jgi:hypothetical protein
MRPLYIAIPAWSPEYVGTAVRFVVPSLLASLSAGGYGPELVRFQVWTDDSDAFRAALAGWPVDFRDVALPWGGSGRTLASPGRPAAGPAAIVPGITPPRTRSELYAQLATQHADLLAGRPPASSAHPARPSAPALPRRDPLPREYWAAFMQAHRDAINLTPQGAICCLFNADIVPSVETFGVIGAALESGERKVAISVGIRTLLDGNECPIGADAETLSRWIWAHRHQITDDCIWGTGTTRHPTILFFNHPNGSVSMHCFHLTPMFILKDRPLMFKGTIDDDLLGHYRDKDLMFLSDRACCFAELSYAWKGHARGVPLSVEGVTDFGRRKFRPAHVRNFRHRFRVLGNPSANHPAADQIIAALS